MIGWVLLAGCGVPAPQSAPDPVAPVQPVPARPETPAPAPVEAPAFLGRSVPEGWVDLASLNLQVEARYATPDNFVGHALAGYGWPAAWMRAGPAMALAEVDATLRSRGLALRVYDAYRPVRASQAMVAWAEREHKTDLLANGYIAAKSGHNKGHTVDLTLVHLVSGEPLDMGTAYDHFGPESHTANSGTEAVEKNRAVLVDAMATHGFKNYAKEWWHFSHAGSAGPALDVPYGCAEALIFVAPTENTPGAWSASTGPCLEGLN